MGRLKAPENEFSPSTLPPDHRLVMIGIPRGSGNFECIDPEGEERLVEVGTKLKKMVLITRGESLGERNGVLGVNEGLGDFGFIRIFPPSPEPSKGTPMGKSNLVGEIVSMISSKEVKAWKKAGEWYAAHHLRWPSLTGNRPEGFGDPPTSTVETTNRRVDDDELPPQPEKEDEGYESDNE